MRRQWWWICWFCWLVSLQRRPCWLPSLPPASAQLLLWVAACLRGSSLRAAQILPQVQIPARIPAEAQVMPIFPGVYLSMESLQANGTRAYRFFLFCLLGRFSCPLLRYSFLLRLRGVRSLDLWPGWHACGRFSGIIVCWWLDIAQRPSARRLGRGFPHGYRFSLRHGKTSGPTSSSDRKVARAGQNEWNCFRKKHKLCFVDGESSWLISRFEIGLEPLSKTSTVWEAKVVDPF